MHLRFTLAAALALLATATIATHAEAAPFQAVQADRSSVTFTYQQMGVRMDGRFRKFTSKLDFDPARPEAAKASVEIELASVDAGSGDADGELATRSWFNTAAFPKASFTSRQIKAAGPGRYDVTGTLTLKGQSREIAFPLQLATSGNQGVFTGAFTIRRGDFAIGEGMWSKFDVVANDVQVRFQLTATAAGK